MAPHMDAKESSRTGDEDGQPSAIASEKVGKSVPTWRKLWGIWKSPGRLSNSELSSDEFKDIKARPAKSSLGILNDRETVEVPGT